MSIERKRWAQRAQELRFQQLSIVRKQAEGWRTGLAGLTTILSAVLVVKGRDTVAGLEAWIRATAAGLLMAALAILVAATVLAIRSASGTPGSEILLTGEDLRAWTRNEVLTVGRRIRWASGLTVSALVVLAAAVGLTWFGPEEKATKPVIEVIGPGGRICGELIGSTEGELVIKDKKVHRIALSRVISIDPVKTCDRT